MKAKLVFRAHSRTGSKGMQKILSQKYNIKNELETAQWEALTLQYYLNVKKVISFMVLPLLLYFTNTSLFLIQTSRTQ